MTTFTLPAGCSMRMTASMEPTDTVKHRWGMALYLAEGGPAAEPQASYGSRIGRGETQRIDAAPHASSRRCEIQSAHEAGQGWEPDLAEVTLDTPDDLSISFHHPSAGEAKSERQACVFAIHFSPAISPA
jgi:hypothetical protein